MNMKKISGIVAGVALAFGMAAPASAVTITSGNYKITFNAFDAGTVGYGDTSGTKCTTVTGCDAAVLDASTKAPNAQGSEDTWGIFSVQSITNLTNGKAEFTAGKNGEYLTGTFGGLFDTKVVVNDDGFGSATAIGSTGGWLKMWLTNQNYDSSKGPTARIGTDGYDGISNVGGTLYLSAVFGQSPIAGQPDYTYFSKYNNNTLSGQSQGFLDVTGGSAASMFDTNGQPDPNGNMHDLFLKATYGRTATAAYGWTVDATGDVQGAGKVPEPGSLALLGLGMAGLAGLRRRRK